MTRALSGRTVVVTRDEPTDGPLGSALSAHGARVHHVQCVEVAPPRDPEALRRGLARAAEYDWLFVTSPRAARVAAEALGEGWPRRVAAVGQRTAAALRQAGREPDVVGTAGAGELPERMADVTPLTDRTVLFPASERAGPEGVRALEAAGAHVTKVIAYRILAREGASAELRALARDPAVHALTFTSPSAAEALGSTVGLEGSPCRIAAIGRTTAAALEAAGWSNLVIAERPDFDSLAQALAEAFHSGKV